MEDEREILDRRSVRLKGYDYRRGGIYFVTICAHGHENLFGEIVAEEMRLNRLGEVVRECWEAVPEHFPQVSLDRFVIMPNHLHGLLVVGAQHAVPIPELRSVPSPSPSEAGGEQGLENGARVQWAQHAAPLQIERPEPGSLATIVRSFKAAVTKRIKELTGATRAGIWQRNYYEHIVRDDDDLYNIRRYIYYNPIKWKDGGQDW